MIAVVVVVHQQQQPQQDDSSSSQQKTLLAGNNGSKVGNKDKDHNNKYLCLLTIHQFIRYRTLLKRLEDLLCLQQQLILKQIQQHDDEDRQSNHANKDRAISNKDCTICCNLTEGAVLSCCSHALCYDCEKRWLRRKLMCPFCRYRFKNVNEIRRTGCWDLTSSMSLSSSYSNSNNEGGCCNIHKELENDILQLRNRIQEFWACTNAPNDETSEHFKTSYVQLQRRKKIHTQLVVHDINNDGDEGDNGNSCSTSFDDEEFVLIEYR